MTTTTTSTPDLAGASPVARTTVTVERAPGAARVRMRVDSDVLRPAVRPMLLDRSEAGARVSLVPDGALLLAGDHVALEITVGAGARLELMEPTGTVAYAMSGGSASWDVAITLAEDAALVWAGEPFVVAAGARVRRRTVVSAAEGARLALRETTVLGRYGEGPGVVDQTWQADAPAGTVLAEDLHLGAASSLPGLLGPHRVLTGVVLLGCDAPVEEASADRYDLDGGGVLWRRLAGDAHAASLAGAWACARCAVA